MTSLGCLCRHGCPDGVDVINLQVSVTYHIWSRVVGFAPRSTTQTLPRPTSTAPRTVSQKTGVQSSSQSLSRSSQLTPSATLPPRHVHSPARESPRKKSSRKSWPATRMAHYWGGKTKGRGGRRSVPPRFPPLGSLTPSHRKCTAVR